MANPSRNPRILVVKLSSLGDLFHALPAVHGLKTGLKAAIDWVTQEQYAELVRCFTDIDHVFALPRRAGIANFFRALRAFDYDLIIDFQGILKSAVVTRLAHGQQRLGPSFHREGSRWFYSAVAGPRDKNRHAVDENLDVLRYLGLPVLPVEFPVSVPTYPVGRPSPRVALAPFSRWPSKNWPAAAFVDLGRELQERSNAAIFLVGAPGDAQACADMAKDFRQPAVNLAGQTPLPALGGLLKAMDLVVTNDSGPMHMAAALGTPVLAIFGPTDPRRTGPYGAGHRVITGKLLCQPCFSRECRFKDGSCLRTVTPETVAAAAVEMLKERSRQTAV